MGLTWSDWYDADQFKSQVYSMLTDGFFEISGIDQLDLE